MEAIEAIMTRRSIRQYEERPVPEETVEELLQAAMMAPSAGNQQPWQFVVLTDRKLLDAVPAVHPNCRMILQTPVAVLVCGDLSREMYPGYWPQDCAAAIENLLLAAHAKGLGAVWTGVYPRDDRVAALRKLLGLPENVVPMALIPIGWPAERPAPPDRYDPARVHRNGW